MNNVKMLTEEFAWHVAPWLPREQRRKAARRPDWFAYGFYVWLLVFLVLAAVLAHMWVSARVARAEDMPPLTVELRLPVVSK